MHPMGFALVATSILAAGGVVVGHHTGFFDELRTPMYDFSGVDCDQPLVPLAAGERSLVLAFDNQADATPIRVCVFDEAGIKRYDATLQLQEATDQTHVIELSRETYGVITLVENREARGAAWGGSTVDLERCDRLLEEAIRVEGSHVSKSGTRARCTHRSPVHEQASSNEAAVWADDPSARFGGGATVALLSLSALPLLVLGRRWVQFLFLGLFTRLQRPRILDQHTRSRIHELVVAEPGIHASAIAQRLELAGGQTLHHLRVLVREKAFACVRSVGRNHYFVQGRYPPRQMRLLAALRQSSVRRVYQRILARPGASLGELSRDAGISMGRASKIASRLAREGLIVKEPQGHTVRLHAVL